MEAIHSESGGWGKHFTCMCQAQESPPQVLTQAVRSPSSGGGKWGGDPTPLSAVLAPAPADRHFPLLTPSSLPPRNVSTTGPQRRKPTDPSGSASKTQKSVRNIPCGSSPSRYGEVRPSPASLKLRPSLPWEPGVDSSKPSRTHI